MEGGRGGGGSGCSIFCGDLGCFSFLEFGSIRSLVQVAKNVSRCSMFFGPFKWIYIVICLFKCCFKLLGFFELYRLSKSLYFFDAAYVVSSSIVFYIRSVSFLFQAVVVFLSCFSRFFFF